MPNHKLFELRMSITSGSFYPGNIYLILSIALGFMAFLDKKVLYTESTIDEFCTEIEDYKVNKPIRYHYMVIKIVYFVMLAVFGLVVVGKVISLITFGLCPVCKYNCQRRFLKHIDSVDNVDHFIS